MHPGEETDHITVEFIDDEFYLEVDVGDEAVDRRWCLYGWHRRRPVVADNAATVAPLPRPSFRAQHLRGIGP